MDEFPATNKSVGEANGSNQPELSEDAWQKWIRKGKAQDAARRKRFFLLLWFLLPAGVLLALWALVLGR